MSGCLPFRIQTAPGRTLHGLVDLPERSGRRPAVIICHGFKGFMEWGFFPHLAHLLAARGFVAVRFNFSGAGMQPGDDLVTDPEAFARATPGNDVEEIRAVLDAVTGGDIAPGRIDADRLGLVGHSRGGGASILAAADESRLAALVTWAAVATFDRLSADEKALWRATGRVPILNARTGQELSLDLSVLEDLEQRAADYDLESAAAGIDAPWLIIHGAEDETVPPGEAQRLAAAAGENGRLEMIPEGSHTFGAIHPFAGPTPQLIQALNLTQTWLREHLA